MKKSPAAPVVNCEGDFSLSSLKQSLQPHQAALLGHIQPQGAPSFQGSNGLNLRLTNSAVEAGLIWMVFNFVCGRFSRSAEQQNVSCWYDRNFCFYKSVNSVFNGLHQQRWRDTFNKKCVSPNVFVLVSLDKRLELKGQWFQVGGNTGEQVDHMFALQPKRLLVRSLVFQCRKNLFWVC